MKNKLDFSKPLVVLAPLAGYTDLPFRKVVKKFGVDLTISEMISSNALAHKNPKTIKMLEKSSNEDPYIVQISGSDPDIVKQAVEVINEYDHIDGIDLNCGCPAPKVFGHGSGSNLLGDLPRLKEILQTIKDTSNKQYTTIKVRIGVDDKIPLEIAQAIEEVGVDMVSVHGRTRKGKYKTEVDYDAIKIIKENVSCPVIANGDIKDRNKALEVLEYTGANGVMIGRGSVGKPWIFEQIKNNNDKISYTLKKDIILEHFDAMVEYYGEYGCVMFRKHLHTYSKGYEGANNFREKINHISQEVAMRELIEDFFSVE
jgi:tRNA-dihydrouridine synthase B